MWRCRVRCQHVRCCPLPAGGVGPRELGSNSAPACRETVSCLKIRIVNFSPFAFCKNSLKPSQVDPDDGDVGLDLNRQKRTQPDAAVCESPMQSGCPSHTLTGYGVPVTGWFKVLLHATQPEWASYRQVCKSVALLSQSLGAMVGTWLLLSGIRFHKATRHSTTNIPTSR